MSEILKRINSELGDGLSRLKEEGEAFLNKNKAQQQLRSYEKEIEKLLPRLGLAAYEQYNEKESGFEEIDSIISHINTKYEAIQMIRDKLEEDAKERDRLKGVPPRHDSLKCPACSSEFKAGDKFCHDCGNPLPSEDELREKSIDRCHECDTVIPESAKFCIQCGAKRLP